MPSKIFYASTEYAKVYDFTKLDRPEATLNLSVRYMVMQLKTLDGRDVDFHLAFPSHLATQARDIVAQLRSLIRFAYGKSALSVLTSTEAKKAIKAPWDPKRMCVVSKDDKNLEAMIVATNTMMNSVNDGDLSDIESGNDSIDTAAELDNDEELANQEYWWNRASSNASVSILDTRIR